MKATNGRDPPTQNTTTHKGNSASLIAPMPLRADYSIHYNILKLQIMKTTVIESNKTNAKFSGTPASGKAEQPKVNGLPVSKEFDKKAEESKAETTANVQATEQPKTEQTANTTVQKLQAEQVKPEAPTAEAPKAEATPAKAEPTKAEIKEAFATQKPVLNLESTLKLVEELHRRKVQRDKLLDTIGTLETFEVAQKDDAEETDNNHFQGCELTIEDDKRRQFVTKNPFIIKKVAEYINSLCMDRLAEIEGEIFLPA